jgi:general secretion pathway protein G
MMHGIRRIGTYQPGRRAWRQRGFSLIELLLVLVILGTLAAIIVPKFVGRSEQAKNTAAQSDILQLESSLDAFEVDCGRYPTEQEGLTALYQAPSDVKNWHGPYVKEGVAKDPWGQAYVYRLPGRNNTASFDLLSPGPNGQEGDGDDIVNWKQEK